jgi:hypothetical protein
LENERKLAGEITGEFILGVDVLRTYDAFMDLGHHMP